MGTSQLPSILHPLEQIVQPYWRAPKEKEIIELILLQDRHQPEAEGNQITLLEELLTEAIKSVLHQKQEGTTRKG